MDVSAKYYIKKKKGPFIAFTVDSGLDRMCIWKGAKVSWAQPKTQRLKRYEYMFFGWPALPIIIWSSLAQLRLLSSPFLCSGIPHKTIRFSTWISEKWCCRNKRDGRVLQQIDEKVLTVVGRWCNFLLLVFVGLSLLLLIYCLVLRFYTWNGFVYIIALFNYKVLREKIEIKG